MIRHKSSHHSSLESRIPRNNIGDFNARVEQKLTINSGRRMSFQDQGYKSHPLEPVYPKTYISLSFCHLLKTFTPTPYPKKKKYHCVFFFQPYVLVTKDH